MPANENNKLISNSKNPLLILTFFYFLFFQSAHQDIESHAQLIKSVVQLCQEYSEKLLQLKKRRRKRKTSAKSIESPEAAASCPSTVNCSTAAAVPACPTVTIGQVIEQRWHQLWLRSLEWQCFLEQLAWKSKRLKKVGCSILNILIKTKRNI